MLAGVLVILGVIVLLTLVPVAADAEEAVMRSPEFKAAISVFSSLNLAAGILALPLLLALYRALRGTSLASALFGVVLGVLAVVFVTLTTAANLIAFPFLSDLFIAATTDAERTTVVLLWQAAGSIFNTAFFAGILLLSLSFIALGVAMLGNRDFGKGFGGVSVVLGVFGFLVTSLGLVLAIPFALGAIPFLIFLLLFGWKVYSLSRTA